MTNSKGYEIGILPECNKLALEQLLNKLIKKGWKPFGITCTDFIKGTGLEGIPSYCFNPHPHMGFPGGTRKYHRPSLRQIVSKESGLWQFVCDNGMIRNEKLTHNWVSQVEWGLDVNCKRKTTPEDYQYRLIESSLIDEDELEQFLLDNIKV